MTLTLRLASWAVLAVGLTSCGSPTGERPTSNPSTPVIDASNSFGADLAFLRQHTPVIVLQGDQGRAQVAIAPAYQGRVMTSSANGADSTSHGYLNRPVIAAGTRQPHMTVVGGEDRFWLGPEGGQYALYFGPGAAFDPEHWQVPEPIDWGAWPVVDQTDREVTFRHDMTVSNYSNARFMLRVDRTIRLLDRDAVARLLGQAPGANTHVVAYESDNRITNTGSAAWKKETGLISIWILGMYRPSARTTVVVPFVKGPDRERGPAVNDKYFGAIEPDRLRVGDGVLFFRGDGNKRGKIGVSRPRARDVAGSYDPERHVLTLVQFGLPADAADYVNSMWEKQQHPYAGDVVNSYNDGPMTPGAAPLGSFYELESSSPAAALQPNASLRHLHRTVHLQGPDAELDVIARAMLGVSLEQITSSLGR